MAPLAQASHSKPEWLLRRLLAAAALLLVGLFILAHVLSDRAVTRHVHEAEGEFRREAVLRVEVHAQLIHRLFDHVDTIHALAAQAFRGQAMAEDAVKIFIEDQLRALTRQQRSGVFQVAVIGANGQLKWSTVPGASPIDLSDREHFRVHAAGERGSHISTPLVGRASVLHSVQLTRPILDQDGRFLGVTVVSVDPALIAHDLALVPMRENGRVLLVRTDGLVLASADPGDGWAGQQLGSVNLRRILADPQGVEFLRGSRTGQNRIASWRQIPDWPVVVVHSLPRAAAVLEGQALARPERLMILSSTLAIFCLVGAGSMLLYAILSRQAARYANLAKTETDQTLAALPGAAYRLDIDADGSIDWQPAAKALVAVLGAQPLPASEGHEPFAGMLDREGRTARQEFSRCLLEKGEAIAEYNVIAPSAPLRRVREHARVFLSGSDGTRQVAGLLADVTAQRELEARLINAAKMNTLGAMASGIAHEVNQPAAAIALSADVALLELQDINTPGVERVRNRLEEMAQQAIRLREVISHFRAFSGVEEGQRPPSFERLDAAIDGARRIIEGMLHGLGISLRISVPSDLPLVRCQLVPLEQVLVNLIINARDAILSHPPSSRIIELSAVFNEGSRAVVLSVRDGGPGFPEDVLPHVFEPFFTTKGPDQGTGLGLSIVHGTMKSFGGTVTARNNPLGGAEVILTFLHTAPREASSFSSAL